MSSQLVSSQPPVTTRQRNTAIFALVAVNALWGISFPLMKSLNHQVDNAFQTNEMTASFSLRVASAAWMIGLRFAIAFVLFALIFRGVLYRARWAHWRVGGLIAFFFVCGLILQVVGLSTIPASRSGFLTSLTTVFTPLLAWAVFGRKPSMSVAAGVVLALLGVAILTGFAVRTPTGLAIAADASQAWKFGDTLTTLAALFFTAQVLVVDHFGKTLDSSAFTPGMFAVVPLLTSLVFLGVSPMVPESSPVGWTGLAMQPSFALLLACLAVLCSLLPFTWMNRYQPSVTAVQAAVVYSLEPLFASSWALLLPGWISLVTGFAYANERFSEPLLLGGGLILLANIVALWPTKR